MKDPVFLCLHGLSLLVYNAGMENTDPIVHLQNITLRAVNRDLLHDFSWQICRGESQAVLGVSGSGKSQLARLLCGEIRPAAGKRLAGAAQITRLSFENEAAQRHSPYLQARWYGCERDGSPPVFEWLYAGNEKDTDNLTEMFQVKYLLKRRLMQLSNGEFRRMALIKALLRKPDLLVLDDLFSGLDTQSRMLLRDALNQLSPQRYPFVLMTARVEDIPESINRVLLFADGSTRFLTREQAVLKMQMPVAEDSGTVFSDDQSKGGEILVQMRDLHVRYRDYTAFEKFNWVIREGQRWLLQGPNGSGKSTLLALIQADHPQAYCNDLVLFGMQRGNGENIWQIKKNIGAVSPELLAHYPGTATVLETVCSGFYDSLGMHHVCDPDLQKQAEALLTAYVPELDSGRPFGLLAAGHKKLLLLLRAVLRKPRLLLLDEPVQSLDETARFRIIRIVQDFCRDHASAAVVWVAHQVEEIPEWITHRLKLESDGRVEHKGGA